jgi:membrane-associated protein
MSLEEILSFLFQTYQVWTHGILFIVLFAETGFVFTPFLPGDSLLFAAGTLAAAGSLDIRFLFFLLMIAAVAGDSVNYWIGRRIGPKVFFKDQGRLFNRRHLERSQQFYETHGGKTIFFARFIPVIRTFAPFLAGVGRMSYRRFFVYNVIGGIVWVGLFLFTGFFFGQWAFVKEHFSLIIFAIICLSFIPAILEYLRAKKREK